MPIGFRMNDARAKIQEDRLDALFEKWVLPLGLGWLHWDLRYYRGAIPDTNDKTLFEIRVRFEYCDVDLRVNLLLMESQDDDDLERSFVHECAHVITVPLKDAAAQNVSYEGMRMIEEHQASMLASSLMWLRSHLEKQGNDPSVHRVLKPETDTTEATSS